MDWSMITGIEKRARPRLASTATFASCQGKDCCREVVVVSSRKLRVVIRLKGGNVCADQPGGVSV